jgi:hypothetical protein
MRDAQWSRKARGRTSAAWVLGSGTPLPRLPPWSRRTAARAPRAESCAPPPGCSSRRREARGRGLSGPRRKRDSRCAGSARTRASERSPDTRWPMGRASPHRSWVPGSAASPPRTPSCPSTPSPTATDSREPRAGVAQVARSAGSAPSSARREARRPVGVRGRRTARDFGQGRAPPLGPDAGWTRGLVASDCPRCHRSWA